MTEEVMVRLRAREISADASGFQTLALLHTELSKYNSFSIVIDCSLLGWIDAQLGACLLTIVDLSRARGNEISLHNVSAKIQEILRKNKTLNGAIDDKHGTTIPVTRFGLTDEVKFSQYCSRNLMRPEVPRMSEGLRNKVLEGLDELFANSAMHSKSAVSVFSAGQFFPNKERLTFVISDGGRGIHGSLLAAGKHFDTAAAAIEWAMQMNNSSRSLDIPGGLGLGILQEFVAMNKGCLRVCSHEGFWELRGDKVSKYNLSGVFPGTAVALEINTGDPRSYYIASRVNPHEIW